MDNIVLRRRLFSGIALGAATVGMLYLPGWFICLALPAIVIPAQLEFYRFLHITGIPSFRAIGLTAGATLSISVWLAAMINGPAAAMEAEAFVLALTVAGLCTRQLPRKNDPQPLITLSCTLLGILYVPFLFNFLLKLACVWEAPAFDVPLGVTSRRILLYLLAVVKLTDVGAYFIGSWLGRHKLIPRISPAKTMEGVAGGLLTGWLASIGCWQLWGGQFGNLQLHFKDAALLGLILPAAGVVGDLVESMLKRAVGAKDSSQCFPGLGGMLDVLDSVLFAAPLLFIYLRWLA